MRSRLYYGLKALRSVMEDRGRAVLPFRQKEERLAGVLERQAGNDRRPLEV
jgi:hypothetical protein